MPLRESRSLASGHLSAPLDLRFEQLDRPPSALDSRLAPMYSGVARVERLTRTLRLTVGPATAPIYCNAQLDDYHRLRPREYPWRPPLLLRLRARATRPAWPPDAPYDVDAGYLRGTAGFGFWNASLTLAGGWPRPPEAVWFFAASPPSNMALTPGVPGYGWKAQVVHVQRPGALAAIPPMAAAALWANMSGDERPAARWLNRLTGAREALLDTQTASLSDWHDYEIEWRPDAARFRVDGREVLTVSAPPRGPLGFVVWIDSQYAIATPRGRLRFGALDIDEQWLELASLSIQPL
jgi:glycosyl hydrolase family 16